MVNFLGKAYSKVDDKGRIVFPAVFKKAMYEAGVTDMRLLVKKDVYANCLEVYTYAEWERHPFPRGRIQSGPAGSLKPQSCRTISMVSG